MRADLWLPVAVPLLVQLPLGLLAGLLLQYRDAHRAQDPHQPRPPLLPAGRDRRRPGRGTGRSGNAARSGCPCGLHGHRCSRLHEPGRDHGARGVEAVPRPLFRDRVRIVEHCGGAVTDVVGDGTTCVWQSPTARAPLPGPGLHGGARDRARRGRFQRPAPTPGLPTRIGLNAGWVMVGNVGGTGHFAYSVVGDTVNTASRIEQPEQAARHLRPRERGGGRRAATNSWCGRSAASRWSARRKCCRSTSFGPCR